MVVCDKFHVPHTSRCPPDALHTEAVTSTAQRAARVLFLSGTPVLNQPFDLFRQVLCLSAAPAPLLGRL